MQEYISSVHTLDPEGLKVKHTRAHTHAQCMSIRGQYHYISQLHIFVTFSMSPPCSRLCERCFFSSLCICDVTCSDCVRTHFTRREG